MSLNTATVLTREVTWLKTNTDGLPHLMAADSGPFDRIEAYWPQEEGLGPAIFVTTNSITGIEVGEGRLMPRHQIRLRVWWPINLDWQVEQAALASAVDKVLQRVLGFQFDKSHGSQFLSAAVADRPGGPALNVTFADAERAGATFRADITYTIDDLEQPL